MIKKLLCLVVFLVFVNSVSASCESGSDISIEQYGITWTFEEDYSCGRFVTGDYWVVNPDPNDDQIMITGIDPAPETSTPYRHGSVVNPGYIKQGYDSRRPSGAFDASLRYYPGTALSVGDSLVSTISHQELGTHTDLIGTPVSSGFHILETAAVLSILDSVPPEDAFRPAYSELPETFSEKKIYTLSMIKYERLANLDLPQRSDNPAYDFDDMDIGRLGRDSSKSITEQFERIFRRPWILHQYGWQGRQTHPTQNMPNYHSENYQLVQEASVLLISRIHEDPQTNIVEKNKLLIPFLQLGIDTHYITNLGNGDSATSKWPIIFAGIMFDDPEMDGDPFPDIRTEMQIYYYPQEKTATHEDPNVPAGNIYTGYHTLDGKIPAWRQAKGDVEHEHFHPSTTKDPIFDESSTKKKNWYDREDYRNINSRNYPGLAFAADVMEAREIWNKPVVFDYVVRWMVEKYNDSSMYGDYWDTWFDAAYPDGHSSSSDFVDAMWDEYHWDYGCLWTRENDTDTGHYICNDVEFICDDITICDDYPHPMACEYDPCEIWCDNDCGEGCVGIDDNELIEIINEWKSGTKTIIQLLDSIFLWKEGCQ